MAGKVYQEAYHEYPARDSEWVAQQYLEASEVVAKSIDTLVDLNNRIEHLKEMTKDAGDPFYDMDTAIKHLGIALATICNYRYYYQEEADGNEGETDDNT